MHAKPMHLSQTASTVVTIASERDSVHEAKGVLLLVLLVSVTGLPYKSLHALGNAYSRTHHQRWIEIS